MAAPSAWAVYNLFKLTLGEKIVSLNGVDTLKMALFQSTSNAANSALTHTPFTVNVNCNSPSLAKSIGCKRQR